MPMNTAYLSADTTNYSNLSLYGALKSGAITGTTEALSSTLSVVGVSTLNKLSVTTAAGSAVTVAASVTAGTLFFTVGASGLSVGIRSANSLYWINSTVSSA